MKTLISTHRYIAAHGKSPRGRGEWLFETLDGQIAFRINASYSEAKKAASKTQFSVLYVCS